MVPSVRGSSRRLWSLSSTLPGARAPTLCLWLWAAPAMGNGLGVPGTRSRPWLGPRLGPGTRAWLVVVGDEKIYAERR
jgi:hypothetical protein